MPGNQKVEQDLALGRQKRAGPHFVFGQGIKIGRDQVLKKMLGLLSADLDDRPVVQSGGRHVRESLVAIPFLGKPTVTARQGPH